MKPSRHGYWRCLVAVLLIIIGWMSYDWFIQARDNHHDTSEHKLIDCTNSTLSVQFVMPPARAFMLLLGYPKGEKSTFTNVFSGQVEIRRAGTNIVSFSVESDFVQECNWLTHRGMGDAYVLNWSSTKPGLTSLLKVGHAYEMNVQFSRPPPTNTSLWAFFTQRHADVQRSNSIVLIPRQP